MNVTAYFVTTLAELDMRHAATFCDIPPPAKKTTEHRPRRRCSAANLAPTLATVRDPNARDHATSYQLEVGDGHAGVVGHTDQADIAAICTAHRHQHIVASIGD